MTGPGANVFGVRPDRADPLTLPTHAALMSKPIMHDRRSLPEAAQS